jgi:excisionase family DNA binding protein
MDRQYLNTKQLSEYLGRSEKAVRELAFRRAIPFRKPAGRLLFIREEIDQWIELSGGFSLGNWKQEITK